MNPRPKSDEAIRRDALTQVGKLLENGCPSCAEGYAALARQKGASDEDIIQSTSRHLTRAQALGFTARVAAIGSLGLLLGAFGGGQAAPASAAANMVRVPDDSGGHGHHEELTGDGLNSEVAKLRGRREYTQALPSFLVAHGIDIGSGVNSGTHLSIQLASDAPTIDLTTLASTYAPNAQGLQTIFNYHRKEVDGIIAEEVLSIATATATGTSIEGVAYALEGAAHREKVRFSRKGGKLTINEQGQPSRTITITPPSLGSGTPSLFGASLGGNALDSISHEPLGHRSSDNGYCGFCRLVGNIVLAVGCGVGTGAICVAVAFASLGWGGFPCAALALAFCAVSGTTLAYLGVPFICWEQGACDCWCP